MEEKEITHAQKTIKERIRLKQAIFQDNHYDDYSDYEDIIYSESYSWSEEYSL